MFYFNRVQKLTRNLVFSAFRWITSCRDVTENTKQSLNWMKFHNIVNIMDAHVLKLILKYRFCTIPVYSAYVSREYEYEKFKLSQQ